MAGETYATPGAISAGDAARASWAQKVHESLVILGKRRYWDLGGNEMDGHESTTYERLRSGRVVELCQEDLRGLTVTLRVWVRTANVSPAPTVQVRLRNVDDGSDVAEIDATTASSLTLVEEACSIPSGTTPKNCRLEIKSSDGSPVYAFGQLEIAL